MIKSYLINLERDQGRLAHMARFFSAASIEFERVPAIDGHRLGEEELQNFCQLHPRPNAATWGKGQVGCFLSHRAAWNNLSQSDNRFGAIFEDDLHISNDIKPLLESSLWIPEDADIIRLETSTNRMLMGRPVFTYHKRYLCPLNSTSWCAGAYILHRETAEKLLNVSPEHYDTVDAFLFDRSNSITARSLKTYQFSPALCIQDKYYRAGIKHGFQTNIEESEGETSGLLHKINMGAAIRTLRGFKRVKFQS